MKSSRLWLGLVLASIAGCRPGAQASPSGADAHESVYIHDEAPLPPPPRLLGVPLVRQATSFSCGDAALLAVLRYYEPLRYGATPETALYAPLETRPDFGTDPQPMAEYFSHEPGLRAEYRASQGDVHVEVEDLERAADHGEPTIVAIQAWQAVPEVKDLKPWATDWDDGHYVVVVGYDAGNLYFMDPSTDGHYTYIGRGEFAERWHDVVGKDNVHTPHIAIFFHANAEAPALGQPKASDPVFVIH